MRRTPFVPISVAVLLGTAAPAAGQLDTPTSPLPVFELADRHDWVLRVALLSGEIVTGRVVELSTTQVRLDEATFAVRDVSAVQRAVHSGAGARNGAIIGAFTLGALAYFIVTNTSDDDGDDETLLVTAAAAGAGAIIGALLGRWQDPAKTEWISLWPAREE